MKQILVTGVIAVLGLGLGLGLVLDDDTTTIGYTVITKDPRCPIVEQNITFFPDPHNCSRYYECNNGDLVLRDCSEGLQWNNVLKTCDYPQNAHCIENATTDTPDTEQPSVTTEVNSTGTTEPVSVSSPEPETTTDGLDLPDCSNEPDGSFFANPLDCSQYYECDKGQLVGRQCTGGTLWNEDILNCDHPENVNCTNDSFKNLFPISFLNRFLNIFN